MLMTGIILLIVSILLLIVTPIIWQLAMGIFGIVWAAGMIALWIWDNRGKDERL